MFLRWVSTADSLRKSLLAISSVGRKHNNGRNSVQRKCVYSNMLERLKRGFIMALKGDLVFWTIMLILAAIVNLVQLF